MAYSDPISLSTAEVLTHTNWNDYIQTNFRGMNRWQTYTPTWIGASTNPTIGNGSLTGRYIAFEGICFLEIHVTFGSTTSPGVGGYSFALPINAYASEIPNYRQFIPAVLLNDGVLWYLEHRGIITTSIAANVVDLVTVSNSTPFAFGTNDTIHLSGWYRTN